MKRLFEIVSQVLNVPEKSISAETGPLTQAKWDSFHHVQLVMAIEENYKVQLTPDEIVGLFSVADIVSLLQQRGVTVT